MKRTQAMWFIEYQFPRSSMLGASTAASTRRACLQNELDRQLDGLEGEARSHAWDRFHARERSGQIRAVRVAVSWEASR